MVLTLMAEVPGTVHVQIQAPSSPSGPTSSSSYDVSAGHGDVAIRSGTVVVSATALSTARWMIGVPSSPFLA